MAFLAATADGARLLGRSGCRKSRDDLRQMGAGARTDSIGETARRILTIEAKGVTADRLPPPPIYARLGLYLSPIPSIARQPSPTTAP